MLCVEEAARLKALADEEEDKRSGMEERISSLTSDIAALTKLVQTVKREMGAEDLTFLQVSRRGLPHGGGSWVSLSWGGVALSHPNCTLSLCMTVRLFECKHLSVLFTMN